MIFANRQGGNNVRSFLQVFLAWCLLLAPALAPATPAVLEQPKCRDPIGFEQRLARFIADAQSVARLGGGLDEAQRAATGAALQALTSRIDAQRGDARAQLCAVFEARGELFDAFADASRHAAAAVPAPAPAPSAGALPSCMSTDTYLALFVASQASGALANVLETLNEQSSCPPYTGTIVCAPVTAECTVLGPLAAVAEAVAVSTEIPLKLDDRCRSDRLDALQAAFIANTNTRIGAIERDVREVLQPRVDVAIGTRATAASTAALDAAVAGGFSRLGARLEALETAVAEAGSQGTVDQTTDTRLAIELALSQSTSGVASLQLPASAGGQLERVRETVAAAILGLQGLGENMAGPLALFAQGDAALNARNYALAYTRYQEAYRSAAGGLTGGVR